MVKDSKLSMEHIVAKFLVAYIFFYDTEELMTHVQIIKKNRINTLNILSVFLGRIFLPILSSLCLQNTSYIFSIFC